MSTTLSVSVWDVIVPVRQRLGTHHYECFGRHVIYVYGKGRDMTLIVQRKLAGDAMLASMCRTLLQHGIPAFLAPPLKSYVFESE
jgi:hypothetical protein